MKAFVNPPPQSNRPSRQTLKFEQSTWEDLNLPLLVSIQVHAAKGTMPKTGCEQVLLVNSGVLQ